MLFTRKSTVTDSDATPSFYVLRAQTLILAIM
jgi:hypothetical protein